MQQITQTQLAQLLADHEPPCISLYQPTHRHFPDNQQDPIRYRNLLDQMEASLSEQYPKREVRAIVEQFRALSRDEHFWNTRTDGLGILATANLFQIFDLQRPVAELLVVADTFHVKPLLRILQSADRFQVLCINRHGVSLYEGNRDSLDPVDLNSFPTTIEDVLGSELTEPHQTVASYGGTGNSMHHGHGGKKDEVETDTIRFFRAIDRSILEHHSRPSALPLLLAALPESHEPFRSVSRNPFLMKGGITKNPAALSIDDLRKEAWKQVEPVYLDRLAGLVDDWQVARSRQHGSDDLSLVAQAAVAGRVGSMLIEADRVIAGRINPETGAIQPADPAEPGVDDLLDDLAEIVLRQKGDVVIVPTSRMPSSTGVAATYRY